MSPEEEMELAIEQYRRMKAQGKLMGNSRLMKPEHIRHIVAIREAIEEEGVDVMPFDNKEGGDRHTLGKKISGSITFLIRTGRHALIKSG